MSVTEISKWFRLPRPGDAVAGWHVSPVVDGLAYGFSWLFILSPLSLCGDNHPGDYLGLWAVGITVSFLHRHFTMPYVYLDGAVFQTHKLRFTLIPAVFFCGFIASVLLNPSRVPKAWLGPVDVAEFVVAVGLVVFMWWRDRKQTTQIFDPVFSNASLVAGAAPCVVAVVLGVTGVWRDHHDTALFVEGAVIGVAAFVVAGVRGAVVVGAVLLTGLFAQLALGGPFAHGKLKGSLFVGAVAMIAALWNIWHTAAQKVGILRVYNAKSSAPVDKKVPLWVDRFLVFGWFPLLAALLVSRERETILTQGKVVKVYLEPLLDGMQAVTPVLVPLGVVTVVASIGWFLRCEWRATRLTSAPRLMMALGMTGLSASFLFASPLKCYVAYGFSHAIEYVVFVWAYQRKRYATPHTPPPLFQKILRHTALFYTVFVAVIAGTYFYVEFGERYGLFDGKVRIFDYSAGLWLYCWAIWHSLTHFYFDGFLWKMRAPTVRQHL